MRSHYPHETTPSYVETDLYYVVRSQHTSVYVFLYYVLVLAVHEVRGRRGRREQLRPVGGELRPPTELFVDGYPHETIGYPPTELFVDGYPPTELFVDDIRHQVVVLRGPIANTVQKIPDDVARTRVRLCSTA